MKTDEWRGVYPSHWKGMIVEKAIAHPAKFSSRLIRRIYEHLLEEGWLKPGDVVIDPFGGVALGALDAMRHGLRWRGVELEERFVDLGNQNIVFWNVKFRTMPGWCQDATLLQGDSRNLAQVLAEADGVVSSPPYAEGCQHTGGDTPTSATHIEGGEIHLPGIKGVVSSPPYADAQAHPSIGSVNNDNWGKEGKDIVARRGLDPRYGATPGQLGAMKAGDFEAAVSSPPFRQASGGAHIPKGMEITDPGLMARHAAGNGTSKAYGDSQGNIANLPEGDFDAAVSSPPYNPPMSQEHPGTHGGKRGTTPSEPGAFVRYGDTSGQLEGLPMDGFDAAVSSPPFEKSEGRQSAGKFKDPEAFARTRAERYKTGETKGHSASPEAILRAMQKAEGEIYGETAGNIGNSAGEDFWSAARTIVEQTYQILAPGAHAVWVVKGFVKNKQVVDFPGQWRQLCEAVGFVTLHEHHAMLVHHKSTSIDLDGNHHENVTESKSFFRRLAEQKGSPHIDWETVWCMVKL